MNKPFVVLALLLVPVLALAQPSGSGAGSGSGAPTPTPGSGSAPAPVPPAGDPAPPPTPAIDAVAARKACTDAMNADPTFAKAIVDATDEHAAKVRLEKDKRQHEDAAEAIAKNQKHVILAYAAMWIIAAAFVMFLWRRQAALKVEIAQLKADLDAATKGGK